MIDTLHGMAEIVWAMKWWLLAIVIVLRVLFWIGDDSDTCE